MCRVIKKCRRGAGVGVVCTCEIAAEQKARTTYDNLLRLIDNPDVREPLKFLRAREIVHFQRFGEAVRTTWNRTPPPAAGKRPPSPPPPEKMAFPRILFPKRRNTRRLIQATGISICEVR